MTVGIKEADSESLEVNTCKLWKCHFFTRRLTIYAMATLHFFLVDFIEWLKQLVCPLRVFARYEPKIAKICILACNSANKPPFQNQRNKCTTQPAFIKAGSLSLPPFIIPITPPYPLLPLPPLPSSPVQPGLYKKLAKNGLHCTL